MTDAITRVGIIILIIFLVIVIYFALFHHPKSPLPPQVVPSDYNKACVYNSDCLTGSYCAGPPPAATNLAGGTPVGKTRPAFCTPYCSTDAFCQAQLGVGNAVCQTASDYISNFCTLAPCSGPGDTSCAAANGVCVAGTTGSADSGATSTGQYFCYPNPSANNQIAAAQGCQQTSNGGNCYNNANIPCTSSGNTTMPYVCQPNSSNASNTLSNNNDLINRLNRNNMNNFPRRL